MNLVEDEGLPDFVMLDSELVTDEGFHNNLKLRFAKKQIYTYIGEQLVSMNPFAKVDIYGDAVIDLYKDKYMYEVQPHVYALADDTFRSLMSSKRDQCVIVTGESGAGKTEATKIFMNYIARVSGSKGNSAGIKDKLLESNPILEAFGNAKTVRNDNSSRFGKYMEIQFDGAGNPLGGRILQFLLEKSRVVTRSTNERSFHVFYQLLSQKKLSDATKLEQSPDKYQYLAHSGCYSVSGMSDSEEYALTAKAMKTLQFNESAQQATFTALAAILHLGNVEFDEYKSAGNNRATKIRQTALSAVETVAELLQVHPTDLKGCLTQRSLTTGASRRASTIFVLFNESQALGTRDSLAKAIYNAVFDFVVSSVNAAIQSEGKAEVLIGVLDIYGFEIFETNSLEQFCINYLNEKLQQYFIKLVLKSEQEEYVNEGIAWTEVEYFNNGIICELIEGKMGVFKMLDEACLTGKTATAEVMEKFDKNYKNHKHYFSFKGSGDRNISDNIFRIVHYAGQVDYDISEFASKNQDTLFPGLVQMLQNSKSDDIRAFFPPAPESVKGTNRWIRKPPSSGTQFVSNVGDLLSKLQKCEPHYIRTIKSNDQKRAFHLDDERVGHQARYLNLVETVRVRRAGFCNKQHYERFLRRYKVVCQETWPSWNGSEADGSTAIMKALNIPEGEYKAGKTKIFIRNAQTLFKLEEKLQKHLPMVCTIVQKLYRGHLSRVLVKRLRAAILVQKMRRGFVDRRNYKHYRMARRIQAFWRGYVARKYAKDRKERQQKRTASTLLQKRVRSMQARKFFAENKAILQAQREEGIRRAKERYDTLFCMFEV
jgi:myosin-1